jgi:hypothetical protein
MARIKEVLPISGGVCATGEAERVVANFHSSERLDAPRLLESLMGKMDSPNVED